MTTKKLFLAAGLMLALLLAACGGGGEPVPTVQPGVPGVGGDAGGDEILGGEIGGETGAAGADTEFIEPGEADLEDIAEAPAGQPTARPTSVGLAPAGLPTIPSNLVRGGRSGEGVIEVASGDELQSAWEQVYELEDGSTFTVAITEDAMAEYLAGELGEDTGVSDIAVTIDEQTTVAFTWTAPGVDVAVDAEVVFDVYATEGGGVAVDVISASAGDVELPEELLGGLSGAVEQAAAGTFDADAAGGLSFTEVVAEDGQLRISGVKEG